MRLPLNPMQSHDMFFRKFFYLTFFAGAIIFLKFSRKRADHFRFKSIGSFAEIKGFDQLTQKQQSDFAASATYIRSDLAISDVRQPSREARGWMYEIKMRTVCSRLSFKGSYLGVDFKVPPHFSLLPQDLKKKFTLNGKIPVYARFKNQKSFNGGAVNVWDEVQISRWVNRTLHGKCVDAGYRGDTGQCLSMAQNPPRGHGVVVGSQMPWIEALALGHGASRLTTIEYSKTVCPGSGYCRKLDVITPSEADVRSGDGTLGPFDFAISYSSNEHSGLGRYGDTIDPFGDIEAIQKVACVLKPGGLLYLAVPMNLGSDALVFNSHRVYGPIRLPLLTANFDVLGVYGRRVFNTSFFTSSGSKDSYEGDVLERSQPVLLLQKHF